MSTNYARPKWWQLYLTFPLLIALFMLDHSLELSQREHIVVQVGILLLVYGLVYLWIRANSKALSGMDRRQYYGSVTVTRIPPHQLPDTNSDKRLVFQLPNSEIKGTLSDTFGMNYIDAEFIHMDEAANLKKE